MEKREDVEPHPMLCFSRTQKKKRGGKADAGEGSRTLIFCQDGIDRVMYRC